jgi:predicted Zn-dependent protease with MMP-like domain
MIRLDVDEFERLVVEALGDLPVEFAEKLDNVDVIIEYEPTPAQMRKMRLRAGSLLLGLYEGIPKTKRANYSMVLPDKITIFQYPIERVCSNQEEIKEAVRRTVLHEIGHHFGMSEEELSGI